MKKSIIGKIITIICIVFATIQIGVVMGVYILSNVDFDRYNTEYKIEVIR